MGDKKVMVWVGGLSAEGGRTRAEAAMGLQGMKISGVPGMGLGFGS